MADIAQWRKTLLTLPDNSFFDLVRNYLGEIQTPFNKQSLLDRLQAFLRRPATQQAIVASIDERDARFLSAVELLDKPTPEQLEAFLETEYTRLEIQNHLLNLQDRLLLFPDVETERLEVNPILEPLLAERVTGRHVLFPRSAPAREVRAEPWMTDLLLTAVFSLLMESSLSFRADGRLKKRSLKRLEDSVPFLVEDDGLRLDLLAAGLRSLGLAGGPETELLPAPERWRELARLSRSGRLLTVWAAALGLGERAACALGATLSGLEPGTALRGSHLLQLLGVAATRCGARLDGGDGEHLLERMSDLGLVEEVEDDTYAPAPAAVELAQEEAAHDEASRPGVVTPSYQMTLTPAAEPGESLAAAAAARLVRYDRYCEFEIDREAVVRAFRSGFRAEDIMRSLESLHGDTLPQNVRFSISTWKEEYERVELLDGVVLLVEESHAPMLEHSPEVKPYLRRRLGPGAFLLSAEEEPEWRAALEQAGLGAVPAVKKVGSARTPELAPRAFEEPARVELPAGGSRASSSRGTEGSEAGPGDTDAAGAASGRAGGAGEPAGGREAPGAAGRGDADSAEGVRAGGAENAADAEEQRKDDLRAAAEEAPLGDEQRREIRRRIERKLILVPEQITTAVVPRELPEARGLDYVGKVRLVEQALSRGTDYLEIVERGSGGPSRLFIRPSRLDKGSGHLVLHGHTVGEDREVSVRVDKIGLVRVVRGTLFVR